MKKYCCNEWDKNIEKVNGPIVLQSILAGRDIYDGMPFKFCPWCGNDIEDSLPHEQIPTLEEMRSILNESFNVRSNRPTRAAQE